jgi:hypothetical protein
MEGLDVKLVTQETPLRELEDGSCGWASPTNTFRTSCTCLRTAPVKPTMKPGDLFVYREATHNRTHKSIRVIVTNEIAATIVNVAMDERTFLVEIMYLSQDEFEKLPGYS